MRFVRPQVTWIPLVLLLGGSVTVQERYTFPEGLPGVINVRDLGAVGDGEHDDTEALQRAIDLSRETDMRARIVFIPEGTYRLTGTLVANRGRRGSGIGPWLWGEHRDRTILKLDDNINAGRKTSWETIRDAAKAAGEPPPLEEPGQKKNPDLIVSSVLQLHPFAGGVRTSANWFMRNVRHLTIDVGDNPDVDGIRYFASNVGILNDLVIRGNGAVGINCAFLGEVGPSLISDVTVRGFDVGLRSNWAYGQTVCGLTIESCRSVGVETVSNVIGLENLKVSDTPQALRVTYPNDWHWHSGVAALVGGEFRTASSDQPAIYNTGKLYLRDVTSEGYSQLLASPDPPKRGDPTADAVRSADVDEYQSHRGLESLSEADRASSAATTARTFLPIKQPPAIPWSSDRDDWVIVTDFGATADGRTDDTAAFQRAIDQAAKQGATVLAIPAVPASAKNWYSLTGEVRVHGSVRHIIGLGWARLIGEGGFVVDDASAKVVRFENINPFGGSPIAYIHRGTTGTMVLDSLSGRVIGEGTGEIFITNAACSIDLRTPNYRCWARQLNPETRNGGTGPDDALVINRGSTLWVMGTKSEGDGRRFLTMNGGRTEIYGAYEYTNKPIDVTDERPIFEVRDASLFGAGLLERCFNGRPYPVKLRIVRDGETIDFDRKKTDGRPWATIDVR